MISKIDVFMAVLTDLRNMATTAEMARKDAQNEANQQSSAMQSRYDTFREEGQYLAGGQMKRKMELDTRIGNFEIFLREYQERPVASDVVRVGSLVVVVNDDEEEIAYLIVPAGGGQLYDGAMVVSYEAPIAQAMTGKRVDDEFTAMIRGRERRFTVMEVS